MSEKLSVFVPTYHRSVKLKKCIMSVINSIEQTFAGEEGIRIVVSNNDASDVNTKAVVEDLRKYYSGISYYENIRNIGIDANHEKVYQYCSDGYVLLLADDDVVRLDAIKIINNFCKRNDFLFAICNSDNYIKGNMENKGFYQEIANIYNPLEALRYFTLRKPVSLLPMLPYFGGIVINLDKMKVYSTPKQRLKFSGTYHQYIGSLWNALFLSKMNMGMITYPIIGSGQDEDKTWFSYKEEVMNNVHRFYDELMLPNYIKKDIKKLLKYNGSQFAKVVYIEILINSQYWELERDEME